MNKTHKASDWYNLKRLLSYLRQEKSLLTLTIFCLIIFSITAAYAPALLAKALDGHITTGDRKGLMFAMLQLAGVYILSLLTFRQQLRWLGILGQRLLLQLRSDIFSQMQKLSLSFYHNHEAGDLMSRLVNDTNNVGTLFSQSIVQTLGSFVSLIAILIGMLIMDWKLTLITCAVIPLMIYLSLYFSQKSRKAFARSQESLGTLSASVEESLRMVRESQSFVRQAIDISDFEEENADNREANLEAIKITAIFSPTIDVLTTFAQIAVIGIGGYFVFHGMTTIGVLVAFLAYAERFYRPIQMLSTFYNQLQSTLASADRIFAIIDEPIEDPNIEIENTITGIEGHVKYENVSFGYDPQQPIIQNFSMEAKAGQTIAFIGETGIGKSTTINLLPRYYQRDAGIISIDGIDINSMTLPSLREFISEVPQTSYLFSDSIINNIAFGDPQPDRNRVIEVAQMVQAHEFISKFPNQYDSIYGADGVNLSQGQMQLICIARAIYTNPRILILDEATSQIDTQTETKVQSAITKVLAGRTSFVIAHRLSTIRNADNIIVLGKGGIIEQGNHNALMQHDGYYRQMISMQMFAD